MTSQRSLSNIGVVSTSCPVEDSFFLLCPLSRFSILEYVQSPTQALLGILGVGCVLGSFLD